MAEARGDEPPTLGMLSDGLQAFGGRKQRGSVCLHERSMEADGEVVWECRVAVRQAMAGRNGVRGFNPQWIWIWRGCGDR
jgi:hypothetical protein